MRKKNKNISDITVKDVKNYFKDERYKIKKDVDSFINLPENIFSGNDEKSDTFFFILYR